MDKSYILPCLTQNHRQQTLHLTMLHADQTTSNKSYILPCLTQIPTNHRQQIILTTMPHTQIRFNHRQQILLPMPHTATSKKSYILSCLTHRYQQIPGNKSYIFPCLTRILTDIQQIELLITLHTDTSIAAPLPSDASAPPLMPHRLLLMPPPAFAAPAPLPISDPPASASSPFGQDAIKGRITLP